MALAKTGGAEFLFVPGLSSPMATSYKPTYKSLAVAVSDNAQGHSKIVLLPGQRDEAGEQSGVLSLQTATETLAHRLRTAMSQGNPVVVVGFSFGCTVALAAAQGFDGLSGLKLVLCAPVPFWQSWQAFHQGKGRESLGKDTAIVADRDFFSGLQPVEHLLPGVACPVEVCAGSDDPYCSPSYLEYLKKFAAEKNLRNVTCTAIEGMAHTPKPADIGWSAFVKLVVGKAA